MDRLDLIQLQISNMKLSLIEQRLTLREMMSEIKRLERYFETKKEDK